MKLMTFIFKIVFGILIIYSNYLYADNSRLFKVEGLVEYAIKLNPPKYSFQSLSSKYTQDELLGYKIISLMNIKLSDKMMKKRMLQSENNENINYVKEFDYINIGITPFTQSKNTVDLGMSNVGVLDQGAKGTCVTFASTAALDAIIGKGDYIDQQCSLELNQVDLEDDPIENDDLKGNYWNGAYFAMQVINPLLKKGVIPKNQCFGAIYPDQNAHLKSLEQYTDVSDKVSLKNTTAVYHNTIALEDIKEGLDNGHRFVVGMIIGYLVQGFDFKINNNLTSGGLWACKQSLYDIDFCNTIAGGHEMVITGYDDTQKLLKVRNSWGTSVGDGGDFYMTYYYFNRMKLDGTEVY